MPADWHRNSKINRWRKKENRDEDTILYYCDKHIKNRRSYKGLGSRHFPSDGIFTALYITSCFDQLECVRFCLPTKFHSTSLSFGPSMVGLFHTAKLQLFHKPARGGMKIFFYWQASESMSSQRWLVRRQGIYAFWSRHENVHPSMWVLCAFYVGSMCLLYGFYVHGMWVVLAL